MQSVNMSRSGMPVRFGERIQTKLGLPHVDKFLNDRTNQSGPGGLATSEIAGAVTGTGAVGLSLSGPQSSVAAFVLHAMQSIGLGSIAAWMAANPILGGLTLSTVADVVSPGEMAGKLKAPK